LLDGFGWEQDVFADVTREAIDGPTPGELEVGRHRLLVLGFVRDVFALATLTVTTEAHGVRDPPKPGRDLELAPIEGVAVDLQLEIPEPIVRCGGHATARV
jgi:hypothetical protein